MKSYNHFSHDSENLLNEDLNRFVTKFRQHYRSGKKYSFREWMSIFSDLIEELEWHQIRVINEQILLPSRCDKTREKHQIHFSQKNPAWKLQLQRVTALVPLTAYAHSQLVMPPVLPAPALRAVRRPMQLMSLLLAPINWQSPSGGIYPTNSHLISHLMVGLEIMEGHKCRGGAPVKNQLKPFFTEIRPSEPASTQEFEQVSKKVKIHY